MKKTKAHKLNENATANGKNGYTAVQTGAEASGNLSPLCPVEPVSNGAQTALSYEDFLGTKTVYAPANGPAVSGSDIHPMLFPFQRDLTRWSVRKGRAAIFADTGLGKTFMQLEWARLIGARRVLFVAPLAVAFQTEEAAGKIGIELRYAQGGSDLGRYTITNYERIDAFDPAAFDAVVLDESSILKALDGKTRKKLTDMFVDTPYKLCCTATPAPNDIAEIANHAEFLGIMTRADMLATFFVHDDEGWRLRKHAAAGPFYEWLASWGMSVRKPSDLGYSDEGYDIPHLQVEPVFVDCEYQPEDALFWTGLKGITERSKVRKETVTDRVLAVADRVNADESQWIVWCGLNSESNLCTQQIADAVEIEGSMSPEDKTEAFRAFQRGDIRVIVTKLKIGGWGLNLQNCHKMAFCGLSDSWEMYKQGIARCYRFGQKHEVYAYIVLSEAEAPIYENVLRKQREAEDMAEKLVENVREFEKAEISTKPMNFEYKEQTETSDQWNLMMGDSAKRLAEVPNESVDLSIFSPPFMSLYVYSPTMRDIGNSANEDQFFRHFRYIIDHLMRITKPGRNVCCHIAQVSATLQNDGFIGLKDLRGHTIWAFEDAGWIFHGDICIDKDPQAQAIRTHSKALLFVQLRKDSSWLRPALADYILVFRKPGENTVPIKPDISNNEWIEWARPIWYGIDETDTLNIQTARDDKDERHICPLQLGTIERCIRLWSNKGETVLSPFAGIGSEGYQAIKFGRRFVGCELKESYFNAAVKNLKRAESEATQDLLPGMGESHAETAATE